MKDLIVGVLVVIITSVVGSSILLYVDVQKLKESNALFKVEYKEDMNIFRGFILENHDNIIKLKCKE